MSRYIATVAYISLFILGISWLVVLVVDFVNLFGIGTYLDLEESVLYHIFNEGSIVEMSQWACIVTVVISTSFLASYHKLKGSQDAFIFFLLLAIIFSVMIIEDAGNIRHEIARWLSAVLDGNIPYFISTFSLYSALGLGVVYTTMRHGRPILSTRRAVIFYLIGFLAYGIAAGSSATQFLWYDEVGAFISSFSATGDGPRPFFIMDLFYEESLELVGATSFVLFAAHQFDSIEQPNGMARPSPDAHLPSRSLV